MAERAFSGVPANLVRREHYLPQAGEEFSEVFSGDFPRREQGLVLSHLAFIGQTE
jgi:hypothetical protein